MSGYKDKVTKGPWSVGHTRRSNTAKEIPEFYETAVHVGNAENQGNCLAVVYLGGAGALDTRPEALEANAQLIAEAATVLHETGMTPRELAERDSILSEICDLFSIGAAARARGTILTNARNVVRFADLLAAVEREFLMIPGQPDDDYPDDEPEGNCLVNRWGSTKDEYIEQFRSALEKLAVDSAPFRELAEQRAELLAQLKKTLAFARALEKHHGKGLGTRRGGLVFEPADAAIAKCEVKT